MERTQNRILAAIPACIVALTVTELALLYSHHSHLEGPAIAGALCGIVAYRAFLRMLDKERP